MHTCTHLKKKIQNLSTCSSSSLVKIMPYLLPSNPPSTGTCGVWCWSIWSPVRVAVASRVGGGLLGWGVLECRMATGVKGRSEGRERWSWKILLGWIVIQMAAELDETNFQLILNCLPVCSSRGVPFIITVINGVWFWISDSKAPVMVHSLLCTDMLFTR